MQRKRFRDRADACRTAAQWAQFGAVAAVLAAIFSIDPRTAHAQEAAESPFATWLDALRSEALSLGISEPTLDSALDGVTPIERVVELDRRQPEFTQTFWRYLDARVNERRITRGAELLVKHRKLLDGIRRRYQVQPRFLVAFWGLESNFGDHFGGFPVVQSLVTLAYDPRRSRFFRAQLLDALRIIDRGDISADRMLGSWAGAMGHLQFIPTTFTRYAVDGDGDGRRDIWNSLPDVFASAANYLSKIGWQGNRTWGREVKIPDGFRYEFASLKTRKRLSEWRRLGVRRANGKALPTVDMIAALVLPSGHKGPAFLVYDNFNRILQWNRSVLYAISVGHLADRYAGKGPLAGPRPANEVPLSRGMIKEMQELLLARGYDIGEADGVIGPLTRAAIRSFQQSKQAPPDGFPSVDLLTQLRGG